MTTFHREPLFDPRISDWLEADPDHAPETVLATVVAALPSIPQRRASRMPWRSPAMITPARVAMAAVVGVLLVGGAFFTVGRADRGVGVPAPTPVPTPMSDAAYLAARNAICGDARAALDPLKLRFVDVFDGSLTEEQRQTWLAALVEFRQGYDTMIAKLAALAPPSALAEEHALDVRDFRDESALIGTIVAKLQSQELAAAHVADASTDPISRRIEDWETLHGFAHCP